MDFLQVRLRRKVLFPTMQFEAFQIHEYPYQNDIY